MSNDFMRKGSARKVFIESLNLNTDWKKIRKVMELAGEVIRVEMLKEGNKNKQNAIVLYSSSLEAQRAIQQLDGKEIDGSVIMVREDTGRRRSRSPRKANQIYIKNLPYSVTWQQLKDVFSSFGEILRVHIPKGENERSKGFGFVLFRNDDEANKAIETMNNAEFNGRKIFVKLAQKKAKKKMQQSS